MPNLPCRNKNPAIARKNPIKSAIKPSMKDSIHFPNSSQSTLRKNVGPATDPKAHKLTYHMTLKPSMRSSLSKIGSKTPLLGKLLMDYTSLISPSTPNIIVRALNASNCSASAGATQYRQKLNYPLTQLLTQ